VQGRALFSNWLWLALVLVLTGVVVWGWVYDFRL
jgi:hypothetical protein